MFGAFTYIDIEGMMEAISHTTGSRAEAEFIQKQGKTQNQLNGQCFNNSDQLTFKIEGYWQEELRIVDVLQGQTTVLWKQ